MTCMACGTEMYEDESKQIPCGDTRISKTYKCITCPRTDKRIETVEAVVKPAVQEHEWVNDPKLSEDDYCAKCGLTANDPETPKECSEV